MVIKPTLKTKESYSMKILQPSLLLLPPETTEKIIMKIMMINFTLATLTTCLMIDNLSNKITTTACKPPCQEPIFNNLTQRNILNKRPAIKPRSATTAKNLRTTGIASISMETTKNLLTKS